MKKNLVVLTLLALFLIIIVWIIANLSAGRTTFFGKATTPGIFNSTNSYVFGSPLAARAGGDKIRITVFALDDLGKGVANKNVTVNCKEPAVCSGAGIVFTPVQGQTDKMGQAIYDLLSPVAGKFELEAQVEGIPIPQTVTIAFQ